MAAKITFTCPGCKTKLRLTELAMGKVLPCPVCQKHFRIKPKPGPGGSAASSGVGGAAPTPSPTSATAGAEGPSSGSVAALSSAPSPAAKPAAPSSPSRSVPSVRPPAAKVPGPEDSRDGTESRDSVDVLLNEPENSADDLLLPGTSSATNLGSVVPTDGPLAPPPPPSTPARPAVPSASATAGPPPIPEDASNAADEIPEDRDPWIGRELGQYRLLRRLGKGSKGIVYEAEDVLIGRPTAVKVLAPDLCVGEPAALDRFLLEARATSKLEHPNIVGIYTVGKQPGPAGAGDLIYIAMSLVRGGSAADRLEGGGRYEPLEATRIVRLTARGLAAAHAAGIIHRDVKPANVLLGVNGEVKVADFGFAKVADDPSGGLTETGRVVGTANYMSPEQCTGAELDGRTDIYSLGATYFHMLTGRTPFVGKSSVEVARKQMSERHPDPREFVPTIPEACVRVIDKAMSKRPDRRYRNASELAAALKAVEEEIIRSEMVRDGAPGYPGGGTGGTMIMDERIVSELLVAESYADDGLDADDLGDGAPPDDQMASTSRMWDASSGARPPSPRRTEGSRSGPVAPIPPVGGVGGTRGGGGADAPSRVGRGINPAATNGGYSGLDNPPSRRAAAAYEGLDNPPSRRGPAVTPSGLDNPPSRRGPAVSPGGSGSSGSSGTPGGSGGASRVGVGGRGVPAATGSNSGAVRGISPQAAAARDPELSRVPLPPPNATATVSVTFQLLYKDVESAKAGLGYLRSDIRGIARKVISRVIFDGRPGAMLDISLALTPQELLGVVRALLYPGGRFVGLSTEDNPVGEWLTMQIGEIRSAG